MDETLFLHDTGDVEDLLRLIDVVPWDQVVRRPLFLNPSFGEYTRRLQGADADLISGDTLIDIKTTKYPDIRQHIAQLMGYVILSEAYRKEHPERPRLSRIAVYFSRHGHLQSIDISSIIGSKPYEDAARKLLMEAPAPQGYS